MIPRISTNRFLVIRHGEATYRTSVAVEWLGFVIELNFGKASA